ncbi:MAG: dTDP-4-dehydrorhamnose reductase [Flammeovirgaceae bacterium]|jgi:dTDP-4-dehydrorhamnose reductase
MKKILITGANGLLGQKLCELFLSLEITSFLATGKGKSRMSFLPDSHYQEMDFTKSNQIKNVFDSFQPELIIHSGAMTQVDDCERDKAKADLVNVEGTQNLLEFAKIHNCYFLYVSTDFVFDGLGEGMYKEENKPNPINYYGETKLQAEKLVQESGLDWAIARTVLVYGVVKDGSRSNIILWAKRSLESKKAIRVVSDQWRTPTLAEDLALGCWLIAKNEHSGIFHISGKDWLSPFQMVQKTANFFGLDKSLVSPTNAIEFKEVGTRPLKTGFNIEKAGKLLNFQPRSFTEGLEILKFQLKQIETKNSNSKKVR